MRTHRQVLEKRQIFNQLLGQETDNLIAGFKAGEQLNDAEKIRNVATKIEDLRAKIRVLDWVLGIEVE